MDLKAAALEAHSETERKRQEALNAERKKMEAVNAKARSRAFAAARKWAVPLLNAKFVTRDDWKFTNANKDWVDVYIDQQCRKTLRVHKDGRIVGAFQVSPSGGRYSNTPGRWEDVQVRDLQHLGALLAREAECIDTEMRYAD